MNACCIWHGTYKTLMMSHMLESDMITVMGHVITVIEHRAFFHMRWIPMLNWCEWLSETEIERIRQWRKYERNDGENATFTFAEKQPGKMDKEEKEAKISICEYQATCFCYYADNMFSICWAQPAKSKSTFFLLSHLISILKHAGYVTNITCCVRTN